jgi:hypothetical protein
VRRAIQFALCVLFLAALACVCYRRPVSDDFDRYIYEAIVRGKSQPIEAVYAIVKHENPRAEASSILDSPQHLRELEPLYAIRPIYLATIALLSRILPPQSAINLVSSVSLFGIGFVVLLWTKRPLLTCLLLAASPVVLLGRFGTPDALSALLLIAALWLLDHRLLDRRRDLFALAFLFVSLGVRTDNILLLFAVLAWSAWEKRLSYPVVALTAALGLGIVLAIDHWADAYGWVVLFRFSFVGGRYPAQIPHTLAVREYLSAFARGSLAVADRVAIWLLLAIVAWKRCPNFLLILVAAAATVHFLLYPSPEDRYLIWAYIVTGVLFIRSFENVIEKAGSTLSEI